MNRFDTRDHLVGLAVLVGHLSIHGSYGNSSIRSFADRRG